MISKLIRSLKFRWNEHFNQPWQQKPPYHPTHLWLEVTNRCNAHCTFCKREYAKPPCDMPLTLFKHIVKSCPSAKTVQTQGFGEPLLYPHIVEAVAYASKHAERVVFYTNGSLLTGALAESLLDAGLTDLIFSLESMTQHDYERVRVGLSWKRVKNNIERFQQLRNQGDYKTVTWVRMCKTSENAHEIPRITQYWQRLVDRVYARPEVYIPPPYVLEKRKWHSDGSIKCEKPYVDLSVKSNGDVVLCCRDWFHVYAFDNLHVTSVDVAFNSEWFQQVRKTLRTGREYPSICAYCMNRIGPPNMSPRDISSSGQIP